MTSIFRRRLAVAALAAVAAPTIVFAQSVPSKPLTLVVPFAPGGTADMIARKVAPRLTEKYKVPVVVDNRPGAGGAIGNRIVATATGDGHTLLIASAGITTEPALRKDLPYNIQTDLAAVTKLVTMPNVVLVNTKVKVNTLAELIAFAKANPGKVTVGSSGTGSSTHFSAELLKAMAGIDLVHVPYRGGAPSWQAIMAGEVDMLVDPISNARKLMESKKVRALALAAPRRSGYWPPRLRSGHVVRRVCPGHDPARARQGDPGDVPQDHGGAGLQDLGCPTGLHHRRQHPARIHRDERRRSEALGRCGAHQQHYRRMSHCCTAQPRPGDLE